MNSELIIRAARPSDAPEVAHLYKHSVRCNKRGFIQDFNFHGSLWTRSREWRAAGGELLVGRVSGELAGIGALAPVDLTTAEVCKLHVDPQYQRRGIGEAIALALIELANERRFGRLILHVTKTQSSAIRLYQRLGFVETDHVLFKTRVFGMEQSFETVHMLKELNSAGSAATVG